MQQISNQQLSSPMSCKQKTLPTVTIHYRPLYQNRGKKRSSLISLNPRTTGLTSLKQETPINRFFKYRENEIHTAGFQRKAESFFRTTFRSTSASTSYQDHSSIHQVSVNVILHPNPQPTQHLSHILLFSLPKRTWSTAQFWR